MRTLERVKSDRRLREPFAEPTEPAAFRRSTTVAAVLTAVAVLGMVVLIAAAFFAAVGLLDVLDWSGVVPMGAEGGRL